MGRIQKYIVISLFLTIFVSHEVCSQVPTVFEVSGSGSYCSGSSGLLISLDGSEVGVDYQLKANGIELGPSITGTGSDLSWPDQMEGVYVVTATNTTSGISENMNGKANVIENPPPVVIFGFGYYKTITIDADSVAGTEDLINFPMLVSIANDDNLRTMDNGGNVHNINGYDIVFADENFNPIPFEVISYSSLSGAFSAWVSVPLISYDSDTEIYMMYGNSGVTTNLSSSEVWSTDYVQVMHLDGNFTDASFTGNYGVNSGTTATNGKLGAGRSFDGIDNMIIVPDDSTLDSTNDEATFSLWINWVDAADGDYQIVMASSNRFPGLGGGYEWASQNVAGNLYFYPNGTDDSNYNLGPNPFTNGIWQYLAVTLRYSTKSVDIYIDGEPLIFDIKGVPTLWTSLANIDDWWWGGHINSPTRYFNGSMDEIRVQTVARTEEWIFTEYTNQNNPSGFYTVSSESTYETLEDVCLNNTPFVLIQPQPTGGVFSGTGVASDTFDPGFAGAGDHIIAYSYTDSKGCISIASEIQTVLAAPTPVISGNNSLCNDAESETYSTPGVSGNSYIWEISGSGASITSGQGTNKLTVDWGSSSGSINLTESIDATGCEATAATLEVTIADLSDPDILCLPDTSIDAGVGVDELELSLALPVVSDNCEIQSLTNDFSSNADASGYYPLGTTVVTYTAADQNGNTSLCSRLVTVISGDVLPDSLLIPQGFSPNNDGLNDMFEIIGISEYPENELIIYNVWGKEVFQMSDYDNSWDGKASLGTSKGQSLSTGTYFYVLRLGNEQVLKGSVYLIVE